MRRAAGLNSHDMRRGIAALLGLALLAGACSGSGDSGPSEDATNEGSTSSAAATAEAGATIPEVEAPDPDPTPLPIDPDVRVGRLDNGLTYYLRSNDAPGASLDLRLVVDAGSVQESERGTGLAHFVEHMLFNGTEQFPGNELDRSLQRLGIQFGPELNAFTTYDETVYLLKATTTDPAAVELAFDVLAEWAFAATIDPAAVAAEVGVVREELRTRRETVNGIVVAAFDDIYTAGTIYEGKSPIGTESGIESTTAEQLRAFYDRWYAPDNMAVVVVGDLPVDRMESEIRDRFVDQRTRSATVGDDIDRTIELPTDPVVGVVTHPDQPVENLSFDIPRTVWDTRTVGGERLSVMETLIAMMVTNRLDEAFVRGELDLSTAPFLSLFEVSRGLGYFGTNFQATELDTAVTDVMSALLGVAFTGFTADDLARAADELDAALEQELEGLDTRQDNQFAAEYMLHFLGSGGIDSVQGTVDRQRALLADLTPATLTDHWRWILQAAAPIVIAGGSDPAVLPTEAELLAALARATAASEGTRSEAIDELMARPRPVAPTDTSRELTPEGTMSTWSFGNGARVIHLPSEIAEGLVNVSATSNGGWSTLPPGNGAVSGIVTTAVDESGVGDIDAVQLDRYLAGASVDLRSFIAETEEGFGGAAATDDLELLFQLLHLRATAPRADPSAVGVALNDGYNQVALAASDPDARATIELTDARTGGDPFYAFAPTSAQLDALDAEAILATYRERLGAVDDLVVAVVGDVGRDIVGDLARRYVGTLPPGDADTWVDRLPAMPAQVVRREVELGNDVTAAGIDLFYSVDIGIDAELEVTSRVLELMLTTRILDSVREELGASYGGAAIIVPSRRPHESVDTFISVDGDPDRLETILATIDSQIAAIVADGPSADEFERATAVLANEYDFVDNGVYLEMLLEGAHFPDADLLVPFNRGGLLRGVTRGDIRALAGVLFPAGRRIEVLRTTS